MDALLNDAIDRASRLIEKHGTHLRFAMVIDAQQERIDIATDDTSMRSVEQMPAPRVRSIEFEPSTAMEGNP